MDEFLKKNETIHISSKSHLNLTFNLHQCGTNEIPPFGFLRISASDFFTLLYINEGLALMESNHVAYKIESSHGMFAFPDIPYDIQNIGETPLKITWLSFSGYGVEYYLNRSNIYRANPIFLDSEKYIGAELNRISAAAHKVPNRYCRMMSMLYDIFSYLLDVNPTKENNNYVDSAEFFALKAVTYIEQHYAKNISIDEIAAFLGISRKHLYSIFNKVLKISPKKYLIYYRIEKACKRLKVSPQSVSEIAESVGYTNQFYFAKEFKRLTGMTPSDYRKNPDTSEVLSYRTFVPKFQPSAEKNAIELDMEEPVISIYAPIE